MKMSEVMNTDEYEFSYGKKPKGLGQWAFELTGGDGAGAYTTEIIWAFGAFADARKDAVRQFKSMSGRIKEIIEIKVLP